MCVFVFTRIIDEDVLVCLAKTILNIAELSFGFVDLFRHEIHRLLITKLGEDIFSSWNFFQPSKSGKIQSHDPFRLKVSSGMKMGAAFSWSSLVLRTRCFRWDSEKLYILTKGWFWKVGMYMVETFFRAANSPLGGSTLKLQGGQLSPKHGTPFGFEVYGNKYTYKQMYRTDVDVKGDWFVLSFEAADFREF